jgi:glycosyltransferase involved in cell wall biosynthesis
MDDPIVSCICLTHNTIELLERSVNCFLDQTYPNKELIVAFTADNKKAAGLVSRIARPNIKAVKFSAERKMTLGEKRNLAIRYAEGNYCCNWDDDDWHDRKRIETQLEYLSGTKYKASVLSRIILYDGASGDSYLSATRWGWEQTLLCEKALLEKEDWQYQPLDRGEDSPLIYKLKQHDLLVSIPLPELYIYVYHSNNVFHRNHWEVNLLPWAEKLPTDRAAVVRALVSGDR